jgi:hypothetical protein
MWLLFLLMRNARYRRTRTFGQWLYGRAVWTLLWLGGGFLLMATGSWVLVFIAWGLAFVAMAW